MIFPTLFLSPLLALLALSVQATPLSRRDVVAPKIILPNSQSVWPIGTTQTVTWYVQTSQNLPLLTTFTHRDTADLPPPSQITNLLAQIILGHNSSDSLNLDFSGYILSYASACVERIEGGTLDACFAARAMLQPDVVLRVFDPVYRLIPSFNS